MMDPIQAGMLKAAAEDYRRQCVELDAAAEQHMRDGMRDAMAALLRGEPAERDRICARLRSLPESVKAAKLEIGLRIGERLGLDRDELNEVVERHLAAPAAEPEQQ